MQSLWHWQMSGVSKPVVARLITDQSNLEYSVQPAGWQITVVASVGWLVIVHAAVFVLDQVALSCDQVAQFHVEGFAPIEAAVAAYFQACCCHQVEFLPSLQPVAVGLQVARFAALTHLNDGCFVSKRCGIGSKVVVLLAMPQNILFQALLPVVAAALVSLKAHLRGQ